MNLENLNVQEMNIEEMKNTEGGFLFILASVIVVVGAVLLGVHLGEKACGCD
jgi:hypothetical protein